MLNPRISICHRCPFSEAKQDGWAGGDARCMNDPQKRTIKQRAAEGDCERFDGVEVPTVVMQPTSAPAPAAGPGTELKKLLAKFGIVATPSCYCNGVAAEMDRKGVAWCLEAANIEYVLGVMRAEAAKRGLVFVDLVGRMLIRRAVRNFEGSKQLG